MSSYLAAPEGYRWRQIKGRPEAGTTSAVLRAGDETTSYVLEEIPGMQPGEVWLARLADGTQIPVLVDDDGAYSAVGSDGLRSRLKVTPVRRLAETTEGDDAL